MKQELRAEILRRTRRGPVFLIAATVAVALGISAVFAAPSFDIGTGAPIKAEVAIDELGIDPEGREIIVLRQLCQMTYAEVAEAMGFAEEATARKACSRALKKLADELGDSRL